MKKWSTIIYAKAHYADGEMREFSGPIIDAPTRELAKDYCMRNGLGYCYIGDEVVMKIPCKAGTTEPDMDNAIDYELEQNN